MEQNNKMNKELENLIKEYLESKGYGVRLIHIQGDIEEVEMLNVANRLEIMATKDEKLKKLL